MWNILKSFRQNKRVASIPQRGRPLLISDRVKQYIIKRVQDYPKVLRCRKLVFVNFRKEVAVKTI